MEFNGPPQTTGFEHHVWLDETVGKIPTESSKVWQVMTPEAVKRDHGLIKECDIPMVDSRVLGPQTVSYERRILGIATETRREANYLLQQPNITPAHPLSYTDLLHFEEYRKTLLELMRKREHIKARKGLGVDYLGGQGFQMVGPALNPLVTKMEGGIGNLLVADADIYTNGKWKEQTGEDKRLVAKKGDIVLCDTRLMPIGVNTNNYRDEALAPVMRLNEALQDAVLWSTLDELGMDPNVTRIDERCNTPFKRFVRHVVHIAEPKMRALAEAKEEAA